MPAMAPVTGSIFCPAPVSVLPRFCSLLPASPITCLKVLPKSWASFFRLFSFCSVSAISRCNASYCSCDTLPSANCCCTCFSASFRLLSFCLVVSISPESSRCFWASSLVLVGSSFKRRFTSFSWVWVAVISLFTLFSALLRPVVSPPSCTVMPLMRSAKVTTSKELPHAAGGWLQIVLFAVVHLFGQHIVHHAHTHSRQGRIRKTEFRAAQHKNRAVWFPVGRNYFFLRVEVVAKLAPHSSKITGSTS